MRLLKYGFLSTAAGKSLFTFVNDGAGVKREKTNENTGTGSKNGTLLEECVDYTPRAEYGRRPDYDGELLPDRYIEDISQEKTEILHAPDPEKCRCGIELLILVKSSIGHFDRRQAIRNRWRLIDPGAVSVNFLVGKNDQNQIDEDLLKEAHQYNDLIIGDFHDTYRNLTAKSTLALQWSNELCSNFESLLLVDDDIQLQLQLILSALRSRNQERLVDQVHCLHQFQPKPRALRSGKWKVTEEQYDKTIYPASCTGPAILMSNRVVNILDDTAKKTNSDFPIDDVYISGILREKAGLPIVRPDRDHHLVEVINEKSLNATSNIADMIL